MTFTEWKNLGQSEADLETLGPILAVDNLSTLANYCQVFGLLFFTTPILHMMFGFFDLQSALPMLAGSGLLALLRQTALRVRCIPGDVRPLSHLLTRTFIAAVYLLVVFYDIIFHPSDRNMLVCLTLVAQPLLFDAQPLDNLRISALALAIVVLLELHIADPRRINNLMYALLSALLGLYLGWHKTSNMFGMLLYARREKSATERESGTQAAVGQIQPHFVCNMLSTIRLLCEKDPCAARIALTRFVDYMRVSTDAIDYNELTSFDRELDHARNYALLEQLRFGGKLQVAWHIDTIDFLLPTLTLQPLVENAITHGIGGRPEGGLVEITTYAQPRFFCVVVKDNGCGTDAEACTDVPPPKGMGLVSLQIVQQRVRSIAGGQLYFHSIKGKGTTVTIVVPRER